MFCVPFMCILYMIGALAVITWKIDCVPAALAMIVRDAFQPSAAMGGFAGASMMQAVRYGISRGTFSNEAGLGSAPIAHATARTDHPVRQAYWGMMEVFIDTIIMCTATALVIIFTDAWKSGETGASLTIHGFSSLLGMKVGSAVVAFCMVLTAYDTNLAWCFYGETCAVYLLGHGRIVRYIYRDINRTLGWDLPTLGPKTLNGLVLEHLETLPENNVCLAIDDYRIETLQITDILIRNLKITRSTAPAPVEGRHDGLE